MTTTAAPAPTSGKHGWMRTGLVTLGVALLVGAMPGSALANPVDSANGQIVACEAMGGTATVGDVGRTVDGAYKTSVSCKGSVVGDWSCDNAGDTSWCEVGRTESTPTWSYNGPVENVMGILETGSATEINALVADLEAANDQGPGADASVAAPDDDQDQDTNTGKKSKKGKKGKKGGKGRRK